MPEYWSSTTCAICYVLTHQLESLSWGCRESEHLGKFLVPGLCSQPRLSKCRVCGSVWSIRFKKTVLNFTCCYFYTLLFYSTVLFWVHAHHRGFSFSFSTMTAMSGEERFPPGSPGVTASPARIPWHPFQNPSVVRMHHLTFFFNHKLIFRKLYLDFVFLCSSAFENDREEKLKQWLMWTHLFERLLWTPLLRGDLSNPALASVTPGTFCSFPWYSFHIACAF